MFFFHALLVTYKTVPDIYNFVSVVLKVMRAVSTCQTLWACAPLYSVLRVPELRGADRGLQI